MTELEKLLRWAKQHECRITIYGNGWTEIEHPNRCLNPVSGQTLLVALRRAKKGWKEE